jgi:hypothetical protein
LLAGSATEGLVGFIFAMVVLFTPDSYQCDHLANDFRKKSIVFKVINENGRMEYFVPFWEVGGKEHKLQFSKGRNLCNI